MSPTSDGSGGTQIVTGKGRRYTNIGRWLDPLLLVLVPVLALYSILVRGEDDPAVYFSIIGIAIGIRGVVHLYEILRKL